MVLFHYNLFGGGGWKASKYHAAETTHSSSK